MTTNRNRRSVSRELIAEIWAAQGLGIVKSVKRTTGGVVNACYVVNEDLMIRLNARDPQFAKMRNEAIAYQFLSGTAVPVPEVICLDESRETAPYDYLITTRLPGTNIFGSRHQLGDQQIRKLAWEAGRYLAEVHEITFEAYGKLSEVESNPFPTWPAYFNDYVKRYLEPARRERMLSNETLSQLERILEQDSSALSQVDHSVLVHSDYHYENILQVDGRITGIIDFEWAYAGDPASDFVPSTNREEVLPGSEEYFLEGYQSQRSLTEGFDERIAIYRLFLELETVVTYHRLGDLERFTQAKTVLDSYFTLH
ncbi:MAG: aminoglycoside phosphotransferase family protein [Candidatus Promineifilaceae bacterium]